MKRFSTESTASTGGGHRAHHRGYSPAVHEHPPAELKGQAVMEALTLTCIECRRPWRNGRERWRLKVTEDALPETVPYCVACWSREFGD